MSLNGVSNAGGKLVATGNNGVAVSNPQAGENISAVKNIIAKMKFANISESGGAVSTRYPVTTMTALSMPEVTVSTKNNDSDVFRLFDRLQANSTHTWASNISIDNAGVNDFILLNFATSVRLTRLYFKTADNNNIPVNFTFEGSQDNVNWTTLLTVTGNNTGQFAYSSTWTFENSTNYKYYKLNVTAVKVAGNTVRLSELFLFDYFLGDTDKLKTSTPITNGDRLAIIKADNSVNEVIVGVVNEPTLVADGTANTSIINAVPVMTSNTAPSGVVSVNDIYSTTRDGFHAFDGTTTGIWVTSGGVRAGWLKYKFDTPKVINKYGLQGRSGEIDRHPRDWTIEASNTGAFAGEQVTLDTRVSVAGESASMAYFGFNNDTAYLYYRINITSNNGDTSFLEIVQMSFVEAITDGIYTMDTTATTAGEVPTKVYKLDDSVEFNGVKAVELDNTYTENAGLLTYRTFEDVELEPSGEVITTVNLNATGNELTELSFELHN